MKAPEGQSVSIFPTPSGPPDVGSPGAGNSDPPTRDGRAVRAKSEPLWFEGADLGLLPPHDSLLLPQGLNPFCSDKSLNVGTQLEAGCGAAH